MLFISKVFISLQYITKQPIMIQKEKPFITMRFYQDDEVVLKCEFFTTAVDANDFVKQMLKQISFEYVHIKQRSRI